MDETAKTIETLIKNEKTLLRKLLSELSDEELTVLVGVLGDLNYWNNGKLRDAVGVAGNITALNGVANNFYVA